MLSLTIVEHTRKIFFYIVKATLSLLTPILLYFSSPPQGVFPLAWIAYIPILFVVMRSKLPESAFFSFAAGGFLYVLVTGWMARFHYLAVPAIAIVCGTCFFAVPLFLTKIVFERNPVLAMFFFPSILVVSEFIKSGQLIRFPFANAGYTQAKFLSFIQFADVTGVWGILFVLSLASMVIFCTGESILARKKRIRDPSVWIPAASFAFIITALFCYACVRPSSMEAGKSLSAGIVQTNHNPREPWTEKIDEHLSKFETIAQGMLSSKPSILFYPEGAIDTFVAFSGSRTTHDSIRILNRVSAFAKDNMIGIVIGALEASEHAGRETRHNSALYFDENGNLEDVYRKRELAPFGERDPIAWLTPAIQEMINRDSSTIMFDPGSTSRLMAVRNSDGEVLHFGVLICFESTIPELSADYAIRGADFLVNITNDLWSLDSAGMFQHAVISVFRAIETRTPIIRVSNGGYSCYINQIGRMYSSLEIFKEGGMPIRIASTKNKQATIAVILGDWFAYLCAGVSIFAFFLSLAGRFGKRRAILRIKRE